MTPEAPHEFEFGKCPMCGKRLVKKVLDNNGKILVCNNYPNCNYIVSLDKEEKSLINSLYDCNQRLSDLLITFILFSKNLQVWNTNNKTEKAIMQNRRLIGGTTKGLLFKMEMERMHYQNTYNKFCKLCFDLQKDKS